MIEANVVLRCSGDVRIVDISPTLRALSVLSERLDSNKTVADVIASWLIGNKFDRKSMYNTLDTLRKISNESLRIEESGFQRLINISNILEKKYNVSKIVFDEFKRVIVNYEAYGYNSINSLVEDFFMFVDRKSPNISLALPYTYRAYIDIEILSRIQPSTNIIYDVDKLSIFFKNLLEVHAMSSKVDKSKILNEYNMVNVKFKVPRAVVNLVAESIERNSFIEPVIDRAAILYAISTFYSSRSTRKKACLFLIYLISWLYQNIYEPFDKDKIDIAISIIRDVLLEPFKKRLPSKNVEKFLEYVHQYLNVDNFLKNSLRFGFLRSVCGIYVVDLEVVNHIVKTMKDEQFNRVISSYNVSTDLKYLSVELQLQV